MCGAIIKELETFRVSQARNNGFFSFLLIIYFAGFLCVIKNDFLCKYGGGVRSYLATSKGGSQLKKVW